MHTYVFVPAFMTTLCHMAIAPPQTAVRALAYRHSLYKSLRPTKDSACVNSPCSNRLPFASIRCRIQRFWRSLDAVQHFAQHTPENKHTHTYMQSSTSAIHFCVLSTCVCGPLARSVVGTSNNRTDGRVTRRNGECFERTYVAATAAEIPRRTFTSTSRSSLTHFQE